MKDPFKFKKSLEPENRQIFGDKEVISFEESVVDSERATWLERGGEKRFRTTILWILFAITLPLLFGRLYYLSVVKHDHFLAIAEENRLRVEYLEAPRGVIYDAFGQPLVVNKPSFKLVAYPLDLPLPTGEREAIITKVAGILEISPEEIKSILMNERISLFQSVLIKQNLSRDQALIFHELAKDLPGFRVVNTPVRDYKEAEIFAHLIGYVGKISAEEYQEKSVQGYLYNDFLGKTGLEQVCEEYLRGKFGERQIEVDARGAVKKIYGEKEPYPGNNLFLNIDAKLQEKLYQSLENRLKNLGRKRAAGIVMDPQNGKILAMVSLPSFDNNLFAAGIPPEDYKKLAEDQNQPLFNRAIRGTYPPGSTVKPLVAAAALQENIITAKTLINDQGQLVIPNPFGGAPYYFYGYNRRALGFLDVRRAIALSSDIFFYIMGGGYEPLGIKGLGIEKLAEYYRRFKIHEKLGIDLPGEGEGLVPTPEWKEEHFAGDKVASRWYLGNTYHVSIGQGDLLVTPLHMLSWISTIANGGKIFKPLIVEKITDSEGQVIKEFLPEVIGEVEIDPEYLKIVREGMRQVVTEGSAKSLNTLSIPAAGKTGTAQFDSKNLYRTHAWFVGVAPDDDPQIAIVVLIEDGGEGSIASAPVVKEVIEWWAKNRYQNR